jgi:transposase
VPRPSKYPEQFRRDAVELVRSSGRSLREVGKELGVNHETLRNWVNAARQAEAGRRGGAEESISGDEREELRRLRKKVAELELEKEILRKAAQYFA